MKKLFVGNLSPYTTDTELRNLFSNYEPLNSVNIINDKFTGQSRGFGFIEISDDTIALDAIKTLNGTTLGGNALEINEARPQASGSREKPARFGGGNTSRFRDGNQRSLNKSRY